MRGVFIAGLFGFGCSESAPEVSQPSEETVEVWDGPRSNQFQLDVELNAPRSVAVGCVAAHDPDEQVFVESPKPTLTHELRLSGLLPESAYDCRVFATAGAPFERDIQLEVGAPPIDFRPMTVTIDDELGMRGDWTLLVRPAVVTNHAWLLVYDRQGRPRWWHPLPRDYQSIEALFHPEDEAIVWGGGDRVQQDGWPGVIGLWDGDARIAVPDRKDIQFHHDGIRLDDGRFVTLEVSDNRNEYRRWDGFRVRVYDPVDDEVDFTFDSQRYVDEGILASPMAGRDPYHANWMDYVETPDGPVLYVSLCLSWQVLAIDGVTGDLKWNLAWDQDWTVRDETGALDPSILPQCQHGLEVEGDTIWMYDNGRQRGESSASLWRIDGEAHEAQRLWHWTEPGWWYRSLGDIDVIDDERILITKATFEDNGFTELVEVDIDSGAVASRLAFEEFGRGYRSERIDSCAMFDRVDRCPALRQRLDELGVAFAFGK
ncbi:MAG: aryl-sulfate sulfotransferase [Myxococcota bacterium]